MKTAKLAVGDRRFVYVDHNVRTHAAAEKFCRLHLAGELAKVDDEDVHKKVDVYEQEHLDLIVNPSQFKGFQQKLCVQHVYRPVIKHIRAHVYFLTAVVNFAVVNR